jgi:hypothetical protein
MPLTAYNSTLSPGAGTQDVIGMRRTSSAAGPKAIIGWHVFDFNNCVKTSTIQWVHKPISIQILSQFPVLCPGVNDTSQLKTIG